MTSQLQSYLALERNKDPVADFIASLRRYLNDLIKSCSGILGPVIGRMQQLYKGVKYLEIILGQQEKLNNLCDEMKDLIGLVVCDAGIHILSISVDEMKKGFDKDTDLGLLNWLQVIKCIMAEVEHGRIAPSSFSFSITNELASMDFFLQNLQDVLMCWDEANDSFSFPLDMIQVIQKDLIFFRSFLENIKEQHNRNEKLQTFWSHVMGVAYKAELVIDSILVGDGSGHECYLDAIVRDINLMKIEAQQMSDSIRYDCETKGVAKTSIRMPSQVTTAAIHSRDLVGLDNEVKAITNRLTRGSKQLEIVPIVGMPGLGKTTLANEVYNSPSVRSYFYIQGWCCVSQTYTKHDLWDIEAWGLLERSLPDDAKGSRILFTSRFQNLSSQFKSNSEPYHLRQLTDKESWELLQRKLFGKEGCPSTLSVVGSQIAKSCKGLPFTVILVSGILAVVEEEYWEEVAKSISSSIITDDEDGMRTVELSYSRLPEFLKPCLLYFGMFQEDEEILCRRLFWLWMAEGLVQQIDGMSLEEAANDYLMGLSSRSLVMVSKRKKGGSGAKVCRVHDLVYEFCLKKAKEENFLQNVNIHKDPLSIVGLSNPHRLSVHNTRELEESTFYFPNIRTLHFFQTDSVAPKEMKLKFSLPKLLGVLDLEQLTRYESFPREVLLLVHLRYLAIHLGVDSIPPAIAKLSKLESFVVKEWIMNAVALPDSIWKIKTLRHLRCSTCFTFPIDNLEMCPDLVHLDTLDLAVESSPVLQKILRKLPSIRKLNLEVFEVYVDVIHELDFLSRLESLKVSARDTGFNFPLNLKKLTLFHSYQSLSLLSTIGNLPNLEVLKLHEDCFINFKEWETKEGEFPNLRILCLRGLDIRIWTAQSSDNFPSLEKLVLRNCWMLEEVPSCLGECPTLEMIDVENVSESVKDSVKQIQKEQMEMGNASLKIVIE